MPGVLSPVTYEPFKAVRVASSAAAAPAMERHPEAATQTFKIGVPVMLDGGGNIVEFSSAAPNIVYGVSYEPAHNLTVAGVKQDLSEAAPINQAGGVTTPIGAWIRDGKLGLYQANGLTVFSGVLKLGQIFTQALLIAGTSYGITKDATTGLWFIDTTVVAGNSAVVTIIGGDASPTAPNDAVQGARVLFFFTQSKRFFQ